MKKLFLLAVLISSISVNVLAQSYLTRTGKITFFSGTPLENIESFNNNVSAVLDSKTGDVLFIVPIKSFKFEKATMEEHFNDDYMESSKFPKSDFKGRITNINDVKFEKNGTYNVKVSGKLTMHGVTKDINESGTIIVKDGVVTVSSKFKVKTADYGIKIPSLVASKVAKEIQITVDCVLNKR